MSGYAIVKNGQAIHAADFDEYHWQKLKESYTLGEFLMPCCNSSAIPKTSPNFYQFFAHYSDECANSDESKWHISTKEKALVHLNGLGLTAYLEKAGKGDLGAWKADVYFEVGDRKIVIEIQHSYQHLRDYIKRQRRYELSNVESYWLVYKPRYLTLVKSISKTRLKNEFSNKLPNDLRGLNVLPELPVFFFEDEKDKVRASGFDGVSITDWLKGIIEGRCQYRDKVWCLVTNHA